VYEEPGDVGIQDPSVTQLADGTLVSNFFSWQAVKQDPFNHHFSGAFVIRSSDNGKTWEQKAHKVEVDDYSYYAATSEPVLELPDGELIMPLYDARGSFVTRSKDKGKTWKNVAIIGRDPFGNVRLGEPALGLLSSGKILCMMRATEQGYLYQSESNDGGKTWSCPFRTDIWGFPANLLVLKDGRVHCSYGYRKPPYGVRAVISEDEGRTWDIRNEIVIRNDGLHGDLGYPSSVQLDDGSVLTVYYFHTGKHGKHNQEGHYSQPEGTRFIAQSLYRG